LSPADDPTDIEVTMLLCDSAQSMAGKLYILGGGWTQVIVPTGAPVTMALAIRMRIPWDRANDQFPVKAFLANSDAEPIEVEGAPPIEASGVIEVGRPPGLERGSPLDAMMAFNFPGLPLQPGPYVWIFEVAGEPRARANFVVRHVNVGLIGG
jgi:hypothetical protein